MPSRIPDGVDPDRPNANDTWPLRVAEDGSLHGSDLANARLWSAYTCATKLAPEVIRGIQEEAAQILKKRTPSRDENNSKDKQ